MTIFLIYHRNLIIRTTKYSKDYFRGLYNTLQVSVHNIMENNSIPNTYLTFCIARYATIFYQSLHLVSNFNGWCAMQYICCVLMCDVSLSIGRDISATNGTLWEPHLQVSWSWWGKSICLMTRFVQEAKHRKKMNTNLAWWFS